MGKIDLYVEARRLRAVADEARERLSALERRFEAAQEQGYPGPLWAHVEAARVEWEAAEIAAAANVDRVRELTTQIDALASRGVLSIAEVEVFARELGKAVADRCVSELEAGCEFDEAVERAGWAVEEPFGLILAEHPAGPAEAARQRLHEAAAQAFKTRIVELKGPQSEGAQ